MRRRLVLVALAVTSMVVIAFLVPLALVVRELAAERALTRAELVARSLAPVIGSDDRPSLEAAVDAARARVSGPLAVHLPDGATVGDELPVDEHVRAAQEGQAANVSAHGGQVVLVPVVGGDGRTAVIETAVPAAELRRGVYGAWGVLGVLGVALVGGAVLVAERLGRSTVGTIGAIEDAAHRLGEGDLSARAPLQGPPELVSVAGALNSLADRIRALLAAEREAAADLSHRLRTPLTALQLDIEGLSDTAAQARLVRDLDALERAVDQAIRDARRDPGTGRGACDLGEVVRERATFWAALADDQGRSWDLEVTDGSHPVGIAQDDAEALVDALLGNVFAHTPEGTGYAVRVEVTPTGRRLVVSDRGPGFASSDPVRRGVSGAGSTGLGLDIVQRTAQRSGGGVRLEGGRAGATVVVDLGPPLAEG